MASDLAHEGIRVNAIAPGEIETSMVTPKSKKLLTEKIPMKRFGTTDEIANFALFLASDHSSYVTGQTFHVNGGMLMI